MFGGGGGEHEADEEDNQLPPLPGHKIHRCTDVPVLVLFLVACGALGCVTFYAVSRGNVDLIWADERIGGDRDSPKTFNYMNQTCGVDPEVSDKPLLFWCLDETYERLAMGSPICVAACPVDESAYFDCLDPDTMDWALIRGYKTTQRKRVCVPTDPSLLEQVRAQPDSTYTRSRAEGMSDHYKDLAAKHFKQDMVDNLIDRWFYVISAVSNGWLLVIVSVVVPIVVGVAYLCLIGRFAEQLLRIGLFAVGIGTLAVSVYLLLSLIMTGLDVFELVGLPICLVVSLFAFGYLCGDPERMRTAVACIDASCDCMFEDTTIIFEPFISLSIKLLIMVYMGVGFALLLSVRLHGEHYNSLERAFIIYWLCMFFWLIEFSTAMSQYVLSWTTAIWYFTPYRDGRKEDIPGFGICKGYANAITYHIGTFALGSLVVMFLRPFRMVLEMIAAVGKDNVCVSTICCCCVQSFKLGAAYMGKEVYMYCTLTSAPFCVSAGRASQILSKEAPEVNLLNSAQFLFVVVGIILTALMNLFTVHVLCFHVSIFTDPSSSHYVRDIVPLYWMAGFIGVIVASGFMAVFDTVGDTVMFCFASGRRRVKGVDENFRYRDAPEEDEGGYISYMLGYGGDADAAREDGIDYRPCDYAPKKLASVLRERAARGH